MAYDENTCTSAMLKQLAPIAVIPPSPKKSAWMTSVIDNVRTAGQGESTIAAIPAPTACPVVPPGSGMLIIWITKQNADSNAIKGIVLPESNRFSFLAAAIQIGSIAA